MPKPEKKITPKDDGFDAADYDVPIEVEAFNNGYNQACEKWERYHKEQIDAYKEICEKYIPLNKQDETNNELLLLCEGNAESIGRDLLKKNKR